MERKQIRRKLCLEQRKSLDSVFVEKASQQICHRLQTMDWYQNFDHILCYSSIMNEPDLTEFISAAMKEGKHIYLPKVHEDFMNFYEIRSLDDLKVGKFSVLEPMDLNKPYQGESGMICVPGVVFDVLGNRIGFGKGYYDRFFANGYSLSKVGIAYQFQIQDSWETDEFDVRMDRLCTEQEEVLCDGIKRTM